jgi:hypothetical protein
MTSPAIAHLKSLHAAGYQVSAIYLEPTPDGYEMRTSCANYVPLGEAGDAPTVGGYSVKVDLDNLPKGITAMGRERVPDDIWPLPGLNDEQAEALIRTIQVEGAAIDWARFPRDGGRHAYLTKPNRWRNDL